MAVPIDTVLGILREHDIDPDDWDDFPEPPGLGEIGEGDTVYSTSLADVLRDEDVDPDDMLPTDDPRLEEWREKLDRIRRPSCWRGRCACREPSGSTRPAAPSGLP